MGMSGDYKIYNAFGLTLAGTWITCF